MAKFELKLPKMGESVAEATITTWLKEVGDTIELDEAIVEIATDKVDSEVPSEVEGTLVEILFEKDAVVEVGQTIAIIETEGVDAQESAPAPKVEAAPTNEVGKPLDHPALEHLDEAMVLLPIDDRQLLLLRFYQGYQLREIASKLGKSETAVRKQSERAIYRLSELLRNRGVALPTATLGGGVSNFAIQVAANMGRRT